jgi:hypothetical protein
MSRLITSPWQRVLEPDYVDPAATTLSPPVLALFCRATGIGEDDARDLWVDMTESMRRRYTRIVRTADSLDRCDSCGQPLPGQAPPGDVVRFWSIEGRGQVPDEWLCIPCHNARIKEE